VFFQESQEAFAEDGFDIAFHFRVAELALGLAFKLRVRQLDADDCRQAFAHVIAAQILLFFLEQVLGTGVVIQSAGKGRTETGNMSAAFRVVDIIGESQKGFIVFIVILQSDFHFATVDFLVDVEDVIVLDVLVAMQRFYV